MGQGQTPTNGCWDSGAGTRGLDGVPGRRQTAEWQFLGLGLSGLSLIALLCRTHCADV